VNRHSGLAAFLAVASGCGAAGDSAAPPSSVEERVVALLRDPDARLRAAAASFLGTFGDERSAAALVPLLVDPDYDARTDALRAITSLRGNAAVGALVRALGRDDCPRARPATLRWLRSVAAPADLDTLVAALDSCRSDAEYCAVLAGLADQGATGHAGLVASLLRSARTPAAEQLVSECLGLLDDPATAGLVRRLLEHPMPIVRHRAAVALKRLGLARPEDDAALIADHVENEHYLRETAAEESRLVRCPRAMATRADLDEAVSAARIVLLSDLHGAASIAALTADLVDVLVERHGEANVAFGYETPVQQMRAELIERARQRGATVLPMEPEERLASLRTRDGAVVQSAMQWLGGDAGRHVVLLYGHAHVLGRGHLADRLPDALVVLTFRPCQGLLSSLRDDDPEPGGLVFRYREPDRVWLVPCADAAWHHAGRDALLRAIRSR
jgi:HEAT repeat protein